MHYQFKLPDNRKKLEKYKRTVL